MNKEKSQLKAGIILNYVNEILGNLIPLFYTPVMLALLGTSEYGLYKLSSSVTSYLSLVSMGIGSAVTRYLIKSGTEKGREAEEKMLGLFVSIFQMIALLSLVIGTALALNLQRWYGAALSTEELRRMRLIVLIMTCNTAISFTVSPYVAVVSSHERFVFLQCMNIASTCVIPMINLVILYLGYLSVGLALSSLTLGIVIRACYYLYVRRAMRIKPRFKDMPTGQLKEILTFSFWIFVANVVSQLYSATDTVMIGAVPALATTAVAVYSIGAMLNRMVLGLTTGISALLSPKTNKMVFSGATPEELTDLSIRVGRIQGFIITLSVSGFIVFGRTFISLYTKSSEGDYSAAYWVAVFMMVPNMIPLVQSVCLSIIVAQNKHRFRSLVYLGIAILNVIGTWFLMHTRLGIIGAALMTGVALIIGQGFVMNWYYSRKTVIQIGRFWKELLPVYAIPFAMCLAGLLLNRIVSYETIPLFLAGVCLYTAVFFALSWAFIFNPYEKELLSSPVKKLLRIRK